MADSKNKTPFYLIDTQSAFYRPLGRRVVICAAVVLWAGLETWHRDPFWSVISVACAVYCVYVLLWTYKPPVEQPQRAADPETAATTDEVGSHGNPIHAPDAGSTTDTPADSSNSDRQDP